MPAHVGGNLRVGIDVQPGEEVPPAGNDLVGVLAIWLLIMKARGK